MIPPLQRGWLFHENRNNYFSPFDFILNQFDDQLYILCNEFVPGNDNHAQHKSDDKWGQILNNTARIFFLNPLTKG